MSIFAPNSPSKCLDLHHDQQHDNQKSHRLVRHQISALSLTFAAYAAFHASRKPPSIAKSVLASSWAPFSSPTSGTHRLGELDLAFLLSYSLSMFLSGHLADRLPVSPLLLASSLLSAASAISFSLAFFLQIHSLAFFLAVQLLAGFFQSFGWPCVVSVVGNWFGGSHKKGLIMGIWNTHTSVGNILGSVMASAVLEFGWGWSFAVPGLVMFAVAVVVYVFLVVSPRDAGLDIEVKTKVEMMNGDTSADGREDVGLLGENEEDESAIGFMEAWRLPGVAPFAFSLFFSKLVAYTFLYWLPFYIRHTDVAGKQFSHKTAGILSTIFDVGGVFGGVSAGFISDRLGARALTSVVFLFLSIPALVAYRLCGSISMLLNIGLMFVSGYFVNGPYSLITTAVASDLGTQDAIKGNSRALATVTAIIDGTGSVGAALGPLLTGYISTRGWNSVFIMLIASNSLAIIFLVPLAKAECISKMSEPK